MKKNLNILLIAILVLTSAFMLTGCTNNDKPNVNPATNIEPTTNIEPATPTEPNTIASDLKAVKLFSKIKDNYYMKYKSDVEDMNGKVVKNATIELSIDGANMATNIPEAHYGIIVKDAQMIYVMHSEKMYMTMQIGEVNPSSLTIFGDIQSNVENTFIEAGNKDINGTTYAFESFYDNATEKTSKTIFYFDNKDNLKYFETVDNNVSTLIEIVEFSDKAKKSLFEIPAGYTLVDVQ